MNEAQSRLEAAERKFRELTAIGKVYGPGEMPVQFVVDWPVDPKSGVGYRIGKNWLGQPAVQNDKTGKTWCVTWSDLIALAQAEGVDHVGSEECIVKSEEGGSGEVLNKVVEKSDGA